MDWILFWIVFGWVVMDGGHEWAVLDWTCCRGRHGAGAGWNLDPELAPTAPPPRFHSLVSSFAASSFVEAQQRRLLSTLPAQGLGREVGLWVRQTCDVAYEVEDVLDEFLHRVDLDRLGLSAWWCCISLAASCSTKVSVRHDRIDKIKNRLREISDNVDKYKIRQLATASTSSSTAATSSAAAWYAFQFKE